MSDLDCIRHQAPDLDRIRDELQSCKIRAAKLAWLRLASSHKGDKIHDVVRLLEKGQICLHEL